MVEAVQAGQSLRAVARDFRVSLPTVQRWVARAAGRSLEAVAWGDRPPIPHRIQRTPPEVEARVLALRRELREASALGEYGAAAIHRAWPDATGGRPPAVRTIGRILERSGALDGQRRVRRPAPPRGWYLPAVARGEADCDCFDTIEGLMLQGGPPVEVLTGLALHAGLPDAWPMDGVTTGRVLVALQARWQVKVWHRFYHPSLTALQGRSAAYIAAARLRGGARASEAPPRRSFPRAWTFDPTVPPSGRVIFLRRTDAHGRATLLGRRFPVDRAWLHRLVRAEVTLPGGPIRFFALRRRDPQAQPLLQKVPYELPRRRWRLHG